MHDLSSFLAATYRRARSVAGDTAFHPTQAASLTRALAGPQRRAELAPLGDPLSVIYLICRAHGRVPDAQVEHGATFCLLYLLSLDLFDDVQDDDLDAERAAAGLALAINDAITLGFLAQDQLRQTMALEPDAARRELFMELSCRVSLLAAAGQHRDLLGAEGASTPAQVVAMQQAKTSSVQLLTECGALLARAAEAERDGYRALGEQLAVFIQIRDDLRDVYGKATSPDLATGKITYPLACFLASADETQRAELQGLVAALPASMPAIRTLLYRAGAVAASARALEGARRAIHSTVAAVAPAAPLRTLLDVVDGLAGGVYAPPSLPVTAALWRPGGDWHDRVRGELARFVARMRGLGLPPPPTLRPWHQAHWLYVPDRTTIFYPDVEGLAEEVLPFQAWLLGGTDLGRAREVVEAQLPAVLAHEMFHFWRDATGRLTDDHWHEEWAANRLAVAYARKYAPAALERTRALCADVVERFAEHLDARAEAVLARCTAGGGERGYGMDLVGTAVVTLEMVRRLIDEAPDFDEAARALLTPPLQRSA